MEFNNKPTQWDAKGVEPTTELKEKGFTAGYKPPADYFNYLFNKITACIKELQSGLSNVNNTADADKSVKHATTATEANSATKATQDANGNVITDTYAKKTETNAIKTTVGDSNVEYTTQKVFGDNFMPIIELHKGGNLINAVKDLSAQVADMFSSLKTYFATKKENDETVVSNTVTGEIATVTDSTDAPIISLKEKGYTSQDGEPTPENPIHVDGLGDKGYFDGMLLQGAYNPSTGAYGSANLFLCNKNGIPCKEGDVIRITYEGEADHVRALFYNDDTFVSQTYSNGNLHTDTVPSGVNVVKFNVYNASGITPSTAKHISVTINGKYAIEVKTIGKNKCDTNNFTITAPANSGYFYKSIDVSGKLKPNTTYVFTADVNVLAGSPLGITVLISNVDITIDVVKAYSQISNNRIEVSIEIGNSDLAHYMLIYAGKQGETQGNSIEFSNVMLRENTTDDTYEPYTETLAEIDLTEPLYEGDYIEYRADGTGVLHRKNGEYVLTENDNVVLSASSGYSPYFTIPATFIPLSPSVVVYDLISTHFKKRNPNDQEGNCILLLSTPTFKEIRLRVSGITTVDAMKTWLQSNPVTVVYKLATPQEIELTAEQLAQFKQLRTFEPITNIFSDSETTIQYYKANDNGGAVGGLQDRVAEIEGEYADKAIYGDDAISLGRKADTSSPSGSVALGENVTASNYNSHAEGCYTTASGENAHAEGNSTKASNFNSHAEGYWTTASGSNSHAEGEYTTASGENAHAEGKKTTASGSNSHAEGYWTTALENQHAQGHYNNTSLATSNSTSGTSSGTAFVIGNGTSNAASNAFRVTGEGKAIGKTSFATTGADYAEYFEWADGNPDNEDRVGYFVTFADGNLIKKATEGDYILGIVSGMPCVIGNNDECWMKQFEMDEWGRFIYETHTEIDEETGEEKEYTFYKVNPDYDPKKPYVHREKRQEWSAIGMMGVLSVYDDGTCQVNGYCKCTKNGIATAAEKGEESYRVIARVTDNIVKVVFK